MESKEIAKILRTIKVTQDRLSMYQMEAVEEAIKYIEASSYRENPRFRYRTVQYENRTLLLRDDGCRIHYVVLPKDSEWEVWAEYKQCNTPGDGFAIADALMEGRQE